MYMLMPFQTPAGLRSQTQLVLKGKNIGKNLSYPAGLGTTCSRGQFSSLPTAPREGRSAAVSWTGHSVRAAARTAPADQRTQIAC